MSVIIPPGFSRITMEFLRDGDSNAYDITFGLDQAPGAVNTDVLDAVQAAWDAAGSLRDLQPSNVTLNRIRGQFGNDGPPLVAEISVGLAGSDSSGGLQAPNVALVAKKITQFGGQKFRGRCFQPWVKEAQVDDAGLLSGGALAAYQASWTAFLTALVAESDIQDVVLLHSDATDPTSIVSFTVRTKVGSQKRRLHL